MNHRFLALAVCFTLSACVTVPEKVNLPEEEFLALCTTTEIEVLGLLSTTGEDNKPCIVPWGFIIPVVEGMHRDQIEANAHAAQWDRFRDKCAHGEAVQLRGVEPFQQFKTGNQVIVSGFWDGDKTMEVKRIEARFGSNGRDNWTGRWL